MCDLSDWIVAVWMKFKLFMLLYWGMLHCLYNGNWSLDFLKHVAGLVSKRNTYVQCLMLAVACGSMVEWEEEETCSMGDA